MWLVGCVRVVRGWLRIIPAYTEAVRLISSAHELPQYGATQTAHIHRSGRGESELGLESLVGDTMLWSCDEMRELDRLIAFVDELQGQCSEVSSVPNKAGFVSHDIQLEWTYESAHRVESVGA
jgi:hypothetical protein